MKFKPPPEPAIKVRRHVRQPFGIDFPQPSGAIYEWMKRASNGRCQLSFSVPRLPPTVNHMYIRSFGKTLLSDEAADFRQLAAIAMGSSRLTWKPTGHVAALIFLQSPHWITKRGTMRNMDGDNRLKPIFDAVQAATGAVDCGVWQIHMFKVASAHLKTSVYLFDLGDIIDYFP